jgi:hypothetical protein
LGGLLPRHGSRSSGEPGEARVGAIISPGGIVGDPAACPGTASQPPEDARQIPAPNVVKFALNQLPPFSRPLAQVVGSAVPRHRRDPEGETRRGGANRRPGGCTDAAILEALTITCSPTAVHSDRPNSSSSGQREGKPFLRAGEIDDARAPGQELRGQPGERPACRTIVQATGPPESCDLA